MSTSLNNANYADSEDNSIGEQNINIICVDRLNRNTVGVDKAEDRIGQYGIVSNISIIGFLEFIKEARYGG